MAPEIDYRSLVEQAPMIIWRSDTTGRCDYFNERWLAFTGRTLAQEMGDGWAEGVHPDDFQACLETYLAAFQRREPFEMEYRLRRHDGAWRWIFDRGTPSYGHDGQFLGFIGSCVDVTDRVEAQKELARLHAQEVERLRDLIPVCFGCKSVRDDKGYWRAVDIYLREAAGKAVTHGLCEACAHRLYPEAGSAPASG
jgi:PAS domain S-box-containing protein